MTIEEVISAMKSGELLPAIGHLSVGDALWEVAQLLELAIADETEADGHLNLGNATIPEITKEMRRRAMQDRHRVNGGGDPLCNYGTFRLFADAIKDAYAKEKGDTK